LTTILVVYFSFFKTLSFVFHIVFRVFHHQSITAAVLFNQSINLATRTKVLRLL